MLISFIGSPCVGKGTIIKVVHEQLLERTRAGIVSTSSIVARLLTDDDKAAMIQGGLFPREAELRDQLYQEIERQYAFGAQVVLLDGFPRFDDQVRWLVQTFYDHPIQVFQVLAPTDFDIVRRAGQRNRDEFDRGEKLAARVAQQRMLLLGAERMIQQYALPYSSVINDYVERAVIEVMSRIKIPKE